MELTEYKEEMCHLHTKVILTGKEASVYLLLAVCHNIRFILYAPHEDYNPQVNSVNCDLGSVTKLHGIV